MDGVPTTSTMPCCCFGNLNRKPLDRGVAGRYGSRWLGAKPWPPTNSETVSLIGTPVKLITAIIQPPKLRPVQQALSRIGVERMTVCDAQGYGRQRGRTAMYRGVEYQTYLLRKVALEIVVNDDFLERTLETIENIARTGPEGSIGDGKIFVVPVAETYQIGGGSQGPEAV